MAALNRQEGQERCAGLILARDSECAQSSISTVAICFTNLNVFQNVLPVYLSAYDILP